MVIFFFFSSDDVLKKDQRGKTKQCVKAETSQVQSVYRTDLVTT
jgi:hypothetical protein